ncbi:MAG TPA: hypothetical protein VG165_01655 [Solirubrobacteraceae bacterium]|nr:hypothetical protein [Solirubrobacteraceae bacterium]
MTFVTTGLTNGGVTTHYAIEYDSSLAAADGVNRGNTLITHCEADYNLMSGWFGGIGLPFKLPVSVQIKPGPYASAGWGPPIGLTPGNGSSGDLVRYLLVSEATEMFMKAQNKGWYGAGNEGSAGEGLSRFLGGQFLIANGLGVTESGFGLANKWMNSPRLDYVNHIDVTDHSIDAKTGCSILFIYYLHTQLGYSINQIIAAAAPELSGVYKNLTGHSGDPFPAFKKLLDDNYPGTTTIPGSNPDNPFPLVGSSKSQGLAAFDGRLYAAWKGETEDERLFYSSFTTGWAAQNQIPGVAGSDGPSLAVFDGALYAAWKGAQTDQGIWWSTFNGNAWAAQKEIPGVATSVGPSLAVFDGVLYAAWKGETGDEGIWWSTFNGNAWAAQKEIPGVGTSVGPSLAVFDGVLYAAWKGETGDEGIWYSTFNGTAWSPQKEIPGVGSAVGPSLAVYGGALYAVWRGETGDQRLWWSKFNATSWAPQQTLPGNSSIGAALATFGTKLYAMWKGEFRDWRLFYSSFDGSTWAPQQTMPGNSSPDWE